MFNPSPRWLYVLILCGLAAAIIAAVRHRGPVVGRRFRPFLSLMVLVKDADAIVEGLVRNLAGLPYFNQDGLVNYDVVVVDEHSTDQTQLIMERLARRYGNVRFTSVPRGAGRAAAIEAGLRLCRGRTAILLDATGQADSRELLRAVYYLTGPKDQPVEPARARVDG